MTTSAKQTVSLLQEVCDHNGTNSWFHHVVITAPSAKFNHPTFLQTLPIVNTCIQWIMRCMSGVLISCSWYRNFLDFGVENDPNGFLFFTQKLPNRFEKFKKHQKRDKISDKVTEGNFRISFFQFRVNKNIPLGSKMTPLSGSRVKGLLG